MMLERVHKIIANAGLASRRRAEEMIRTGAVTINGQVVMELGVKADPERDHIKVNGKLINPVWKKRELVYFLLNKPKGYLSSLSDPQNRPLVTAFLPKDAPRVVPVGRLDFNTEGLLILTNDGDLTNLITRAGAHCPKVYQVKIKGKPDAAQIERLRRGVRIEGETYRLARLTPLEVTDYENSWFEVVLHEGKNNQIRKMFDEIGHSVVKLRRVAIGHVTDKGLAIGGVRLLSEYEVRRFFQAAKKAKAGAASAGGERNVATAPAAGRRPALGKPRPIGKARVEQRKRLAKTLDLSRGRKTSAKRPASPPSKTAPRRPKSS
jgi:23S rRNA pseudouridine2605 synthase